MCSLSFKTNVLAAQFSMIDAQLLNAVGFEELARKPAPWLANPLPELDVWEDLWREKARWKIDKEGRPSDVSMLVRRFELVVRWVETEVVRSFSFFSRFPPCFELTRRFFGSRRSSRPGPVVQVFWPSSSGSSSSLLLSSRCRTCSESLSKRIPTASPI